MLVVLYIQLSGSIHQFLMPVWKCFNLSRLVTLALILLRGLTQGLGTLSFFYKIIFFPLVTDCHWNGESYVIGSLWSRYQRCIMDHWSESLDTAANSVSLPSPSTLHSGTALQSISSDMSSAWRGRPRFVSRLTSSSSHFVVLVLHCQV